jgi:SOS-response transcriptional repressor LexA
MASCGPKGVVAEQNLEGFLQVSNTLLNRKPRRSFFVVQATGNSMNRTSIEGTNIEQGDYLIVDTDAAIENRNVVLSIVDNRAFIKKLIKDPANEQIALVSESTEGYPPILIHEEDRFLLNGKVVQVIKEPK